MSVKSLSIVTGLLAVVPAAVSLGGPIGVNNGAATYTQNFDTLPYTTTTYADDSTLGGFYFQNTAGTPAAPANITGTNGGNSTSVLSLRSIAANVTDVDSTGNDRALGSRNSNTTGNIRYGALFQNTGTTPITDLSVAYTGEQWRQDNDQGAAAPVIDKLDFAYKVVSTLPADGTAVLGNTFTDVDALDFTSPKPLIAGTAAAVPLDGNAAANRQALSATISGLSVAPGAYFVFRWFDTNTTTAQNDNALGLDDLSVTATFSVPEPSVLGLAGVALVALRRRR